MMSSLLHPGLILIAGGFLLPLMKGAWRNALGLALPLLALALVWVVPEGVHWQASFLGYAIEPFYVDKLSRLFIAVFCIAAFAGMLFCYKQAPVYELSFALIYAGSAIGVTLAADLLTLFVFWETMALASTLVIWSANSNASWQAGLRYVVLHLLGGVILMIGITIYAYETGSVAFTAMSPDTLGTQLILAGFLINAGAPPLSAWVADAYPESSFSGMVFLSAFTTKTAVYVLMRGFPGTEFLIYLGLFMIFYGLFYALLENNIRRLLAYSIVNQIGFMLCGIGIGTELALNGAAAQAFAHIIYKALLLMTAGSVIYMTGKHKFTELGGLVRIMPVTAICAIIGAFTISALPLTSGFVSKSMLTQAAANEQLLYVWLLLTAASAGTFLYAGLKFPWLVFFEKETGLQAEDPPVNMRVAMILAAVVCVLIGVAPGLLYSLLPYSVDYVPYTADHILVQLQLLLFAGLAFFLLLPWLRRGLTSTLDFDWIYRWLLYKFWQRLMWLVSAGYSFIGSQIRSFIPPIQARLVQLNGPNGILSRDMRTSVVVLLAVLFLAAYLLFYLFNS